MSSLYFIFKHTNKCNLRCTYCFEQEGFKNPRVLTLADMELILCKIKTYCLQKRIRWLTLLYTGGEVLTLGKEHLASLFELSRQIFEELDIETKLKIQTNLTLMDEEYIDILKKYNVSVGVSFDVVGGQRRFKNGEIADPVIIDKMNLMLKNNLRFGAVVVITRINYKKANQIYDFYKNLSIDFHILDLEPSFDKFYPELVISNQERIDFLKALADRHFEQKERKIEITILDSCSELLKKGPGYGKNCKFDRSCKNVLGNSFFVFVDSNGDIYPCDGLRYKHLYLGNILRDSLEDIVNSPILEDLNKRHEFIKEECRGCRYLEICNGGCMAPAHWEGNILGRSKSECAVNHAMFEYIGNKLENQGHKLYFAKSPEREAII